MPHIQRFVCSWCGTNVHALVHESQNETLKKIGRMRYLSLKVQADTLWFVLFVLSKNLQTTQCWYPLVLATATLETRPT